MSVDVQALNTNQLTTISNQSLDTAYEQTYEPNGRLINDPPKVDETKVQSVNIPKINLGKSISSNKGSIGLLLLFIIALLILTVQKVPGQSQTRLGLVIDAIFGKAVIKQ